MTRCPIGRSHTREGFDLEDQQRPVLAASKAVTALVVGLFAATVLATTPASAQSNPCTDNDSGYYCYYTGVQRGGSEWDQFSCYDNEMHSYPSWLWDNVRSWDHRQHSGAWISNWNWRSSIGEWQFKFNMIGQSYDSNVPDEGSSGADALLNHC